MFLHLKQVQGLVHHGLWRCALPWAKTHPCHTLPLWRQNTELQKTCGLLAMQHPVTAGLTEVLTPFVLEAAVTPEIHLAPEGLSFLCVQKSLSSLTLQHTSAMQRDNQRSLHPFTTQFCTGQAQLLQQYLILLLAKSKIPWSKAFWTSALLWAMQSYIQTPWGKMDATSFMEWNGSIHRIIE